MDMRSFQHIESPLRLFQGPDSLGQLARELDRAGASRAVIVCGATLGRDEHLLGLVGTALGGRHVGIFAGVRAHSPVPSVQDAARELERLRADAVIAVGGGSAVVTARAASILLAEGHDVRALATSRDAAGRLHSPRLLAPKIPQFVVPTTPNTATVKAGSAVFDTESGDRLALFDPKTRAHSVFVHPDFLASAPRALVLSASLDCLSGAIEGLLSRGGDPFADALLMHAVRLLSRNLAALAGENSQAIRADLMAAAMMAGRGTDHTGGGIAGVLGHAVGARHHTENSTVKAIVLPHVLAYVAPAAAPGLAKLATALGLNAAEPAQAAADISARLESIFTAHGLPRQLRAIGVRQDMLADIADHAMGDWFLRGSPRPVKEAAELQAVLAASW